MPNSRTASPRRWRLSLIAPALIAGLLTSSCSSMAPSQLPVLRVVAASKLPPALAADCDPPTTWKPGSALSANQVAPLWFADRAALAVCGQRHRATVQFYQGRDAELGRLAGAK